MNQGLLRAQEAPIAEFKASLAGKWRGEILDMSQAVPSYGTFPRILERLKGDLDEFGTGFYTSVEGLEELRNEIAQRHPLKQDLKASNLLVTAGANHAMYTAFSALFSPGDKVTLLEPYYFNYQMALDMLSLQTDTFQLNPELGFQLEPGKILSHLAQTGSKGLVLITPNNPTGTIYPASKIIELVRGCAEMGVEVLLDETYAAFDSSHLNDPALGVFLEKNLSLIGSFSKSFSLTGYRVGYWAFRSEIKKEVIKLQDTLIICSSHLGQRAALHGLRECQSLVEEKRARIEHKAQIIRDWAAVDRPYRLRSLGPFFAYVEHPENETSRQAAIKLYLEKGLLCLPGSVFGKSQERFLRLAYENLSVEKLPQALECLS